MRVLARMVGAVATLCARVTQHSAETRLGRNEARASVFANLLASSDEASLVGVAGKRRGRAPMCPADPVRSLVFWRRCAGHWAFAELARRRDLTFDNWSPSQTVSRRPLRSVLR